jgi:hypothetical protein
MGSATKKAITDGPPKGNAGAHGAKALTTVQQAFELKTIKAIGFTFPLRITTKPSLGKLIVNNVKHSMGNDWQMIAWYPRLPIRNFTDGDRRVK